MKMQSNSITQAFKVGVAVLSLGMVLPAVAQKRIQRIGNPTFTSVKRLAPVGPDLKMVGRWSFPVDPYGLQDGPPWYPIFDCFEAQTSSPWAPSEVYFPTTYWSSLSEPAGTRDWFGAGYVNPFIANDMTVSPGYIGALANRVQVAYGFSLDGATSGSQQLYIIVRTYENFAATQAGLAANTSFSVPLNSTTNPANGEVFDMGVVPYNNTGYNYMTQLLSGNQQLKMPDDGATGSGAYVIIFAKTYNPTTGAYTPSDIAQPMLWLTKPNTGAPANPSTQGNFQWDDDNPTDGIHQTNPPNAVAEIYDYDTFGLFGANSPPEGAMLAFYSDVVPAFRPTSYIVLQGTENAPQNTVSKLYKSDNVYVILQCDEFTPSPSFEASSTSNYLTASAFSFTYEAACSRTDMVEKVEFYNYISNGFISNASWNRTPTLGDSIRTVAVTTNPTQYVNATSGAMRTKITQIPIQEVDGFDGWAGRFDFVRWNVTP